MELDFEQLGRGLTFLETEIWCNHNSVEWGLKNKVLSGRLTSNPQICRYPPVHDPIAPQLIRALAIANGKKAVAIATSPQRIESNFAHVVWESRTTGYPQKWWASHVQKLYNEVPGVRPWRQMVHTQKWLVPVPAKMCVLGPETPQLELTLTSVEPTGMLNNVWSPSALISLKEAVSATVQHTPPEMHQPRDRTTQRPSTPHANHSTQPIAQRTRSHATPSRAPRKQVTTAPRTTAPKHRMVQAPAPTRFTNRTRRHVAVTVGHIEI